METYLKNRFRYLLFIVACVLCSAVLHCSGDDSTRPTVASTTPESDATSVEVSDPVWVVFSEAMSPSSITNARLTLVSSLATVSTSVHYDETSNTAIIYHANPLEYSTQYTVTVSGMVSDANGNMMGDDYSFSFTTADVLAGTLSWSNPLPQGNILNGVWSISESDIFAVGSVGTIIRSDGTTWTVMNSTTNLELNAVWGASANDVYAVGEGGVIMHFDGTSWLPSYLEPEGSPLWSIWGSSASDVFVGGDDMILHWNGTEWETMILPIEARITSIWGFSANEVYAVAMGQKVLRYDGSEWSVFEEFPGGDTILWSLWGTSASDMYTGGYSTFGDDFLYHYDGTSWSAQDNVNSAIYGIWGSSSDDIYAVGVAGYKMHYNGSTWSDESSHYVDFKSINGTSAGDIYTVGQYGLIEYNNGSTWQIQNGTYIWSLHDVMGFSENNIYAVGIGGTVLQYDGTTWNRLDPLVESRDNYGIGGSAADDIYVVNCRDDGLSFEGGDIYKYDGTNWAAVEEGTDVCFRSVWAVDDGSVFAVGYKEEGNAWVYHSTDSGATWENEELGRMERARSVSGSASNNVITVGANGIAEIFDGSSWNEMNTGTSAIINSVIVFSDTEAYAVDENGLFISYDGNESLTWTLIGRVATRPIKKIWGTSGSDLFLVVEADSSSEEVGGKDLIMHYDGNAFSQIESIADQHLYSAWGVSGDSIYFVGDYGVVLHYER